MLLNPIPSFGRKALCSPPRPPPSVLFITNNTEKWKQSRQTAWQFLYDNNSLDKTLNIAISQAQDPHWVFKVSWCVTYIERFSRAYWFFNSIISGIDYIFGFPDTLKTSTDVMRAFQNWLCMFYRKKIRRRRKFLPKK